MAEDRQAEGRLGDEDVAGHRLESRRRSGRARACSRRRRRCAGRAIRPRSGPSRAHGRRARSVKSTSPMRVVSPGHGGLSRFRKALAVAQRHDRQRLARRQHGAVAGAGMVGMAMGDQRPRHRAHRIDMDVGGRAIQAGRRRDQQIRRDAVIWPASSSSDRPARHDRKGLAPQHFASSGDSRSTAAMAGREAALDGGRRAGLRRDPRPDAGAGLSLHRRLASLRARPGERSAINEEAATAWRQCLTLDPNDHFGARLDLARIGALAAEEATSENFSGVLFDGYAERFDSHLVETLRYNAPDPSEGCIGPALSAGRAAASASRRSTTSAAAPG